MWLPALLLPLLLSACRPGGAITGGQQTSIELHPYQVAIDREGKMICGGALLSPRTVITAATCLFATVIKPRTLTVRVGSQVRDGGGEAFDVQDYKEHPDYNVFWGNNDALLLYLQDEVPFRAAVQPVALPAPSSAGIAVGEKLVLSGYGDLYQDEVLADGEQRQLQAATLAFFSQDLCNDLYSFSGVGNNRACAGGLESDMCGQRDIGSPLVNWMGSLVGIALQQRQTCGVPGLPTSFTNLAEPALNQWVKDNIK